MLKPNFPLIHIILLFFLIEIKKIVIFFQFIKVISFQSKGSNLTIKNLRTLVAIYKYGSFQSAAEAMRLSQPAVSQQIKNLEIMWGKTLFDRSNRSPELNPVGHAIVIEAEKVINAYDGILSSSLRDDSVNGRIVLGAVPTTLTGLMPMATHILKHRYPNLRVVIYPAQSIRLITQIERGSIDAGIIGKPDLLPQSMIFLNIASEPMLLLAPSETTSDDPLQLLRELPFIRFDREALFGRQVEKWLQKNRLKVNESMELDGLEAISSMVFANLGVSIVPRSCVKTVNPMPVRSLPLGVNAPNRLLGLAHQINSPKSDLIQQVKFALLEAVEIGEFNPQYSS